MSKKSKGVVLDSTTPYGGVGVFEDAKARLKHQSLMQDYQELQKEVDVIRNKLDAGKQRKMILAAEVRFLRRRYEYFMKTKITKSSQKEKIIQPPNFTKQTKRTKDVSRKESSQHRLLPEPKTKKKQYIGKEVVGQHNRKILHARKEDLNHKGRTNTRKKPLTCNSTPVLDLNQKERLYVNDVSSLRNTNESFDLNQDNSNHSGNEEVSLPSRAPIFDLNEISMDDEDFQSNVEAMKFEEVKKSLMRGPNEEVQNDLKLSICRNAGEGPSRVGKRKISWQDPVALRV